MSQDSYTPPAGKAWETVAPAQAGFDGPALDAAIGFAREHESSWPRSLYYPDGRYVGIVEWNETGPWSAIVGPVIPRGRMMTVCSFAPSRIGTITSSKVKGDWVAVCGAVCASVAAGTAAVTASASRRAWRDMNFPFVNPGPS